MYEALIGTRRGKHDGPIQVVLGKDVRNARIFSWGRGALQRISRHTHHRKRNTREAAESGVSSSHRPPFFPFNDSSTKGYCCRE